MTFDEQIEQFGIVSDQLAGGKNAWSVIQMDDQEIESKRYEIEGKQWFQKIKDQVESAKEEFNQDLDGLCEVILDKMKEQDP